MKKTSVIIAISLLIALVFVLAASGDNTKNDIENGMTTLKNDITSMMDGMSSAVSDLDNSLTAEGNVTKETGSTGLFEDMTSDKVSTGPSTSSTTSGSFATTSEPSSVKPADSLAE